MRKLLLTTVSSLAFLSVASAADLAVKAPVPRLALSNWTGCYVGVHGAVVSHKDYFDGTDGDTGSGDGVTGSTKKMYITNSGYKRANARNTVP